MHPVSYYLVLALLKLRKEKAPNRRGRSTAGREGPDCSGREEIPLVGGSMKMVAGAGIEPTYARL